VTTRGVRKSTIFLDRHDRERFLGLLDKVVGDHGWLLHTYCLMGNHFHLLVQTSEPNLSVGMQRLNGPYAQVFNLRHGFEGHVLERRFRAEHVTTDWYLLEVARYIVLNPVRAGLCRHAGEWEWSSYRAAAGRVRRPPFLTLDWILRQFAGIQGGYEGFVANAPPEAYGHNGDSRQVRGSDPGTGPVQPNPYVPEKRLASRRTRSAAGRPTTFR
jgi:REP element-mobilizing transposase RayT